MSTLSASTASTELWRSGPNSRGTWEIISTCLSTLIICAWSAVHVDVPPHYRKRSLINKVRWLLIGLLAPDWLLFAAFNQLCCAQELSQRAGIYLPVAKSAAATPWLRRLWKHTGWGARHKYPSDPDSFPEDEHILSAAVEFDEYTTSAASTVSESGIRRHAWTLTHSYYATMGGFVLDSSSTPVFGTEKRMVLTPRMLHLLMEHAPDLIPDISADRIQCWSKSDGLAKALLVTQLLYFAVSCAARLDQALPLSLLEVWTLSHAFGAILVYVTWWWKPLNIAEPVVVTGERAREFAAYFQMVGKPVAPRVAGLDDNVGLAEVTYLRIAPRRPPVDGTGAFLDGGRLVCSLGPGQPIPIEDYTFTVSTTGPDLQNRRVFGKAYCPWYAQKRGPGGSVSLSSADILRWRLAARAASRIDKAWQPQDLLRYTSTGGLEAFDPWVIRHLYVGAILVSLMTIYSLPHFLGWSITFPTLIESKLWRVASITVAALPTAYFTLIALVYRLPSSRPSGSLPLPTYTIVVMLYYSLIVIYPLANGYLLGESLRQLFHLPDGAFLLPNLSVYFPHFS
ncbi:uncharacterized protein PHACADRAFT_202622 [Phanerochaete carnosa HHB-10118-sp]|uniref:Uncharacterized protein n=1 Tax=Phanerochaete carnosa (strain HHB-10118-sp) TaxID=650164 RepID=K5VPE4_PHACS|nr:uncharacterized protein PHACADRAFT_202622 [Phanerochaete carnosa HHB-10118-sp]EKM48595.1 hypothetical protein PHACADRAFT_202622 [Phanerochaete carnosa HHB-10118-sp]